MSEDLTEREKKFLEYLCRAWRGSREETAKTCAEEMDMPLEDVQEMLQNLIEKGYVKGNAEDDRPVRYIYLTPAGKDKGMEYLAKHEKLTRFFRMVGVMDEEQAEKDAESIEQYVSPKGQDGIDSFLQYGDIFDSVSDGMDFYTLYEPGTYRMAFGIYDPEKRDPRVLAEENSLFLDETVLKIEKTGNCFILQSVNPRPSGYLWYQKNQEWIPAVEEKGRYEIPTDVFRYVTNTTNPIKEAIALIGLTPEKRKPAVSDIRELNIHVW